MAKTQNTSKKKHVTTKQTQKKTHKTHKKTHTKKHAKTAQNHRANIMSSKHAKRLLQKNLIIKII